MVHLCFWQIVWVRNIIMLPWRLKRGDKQIIHTCTCKSNYANWITSALISTVVHLLKQCAYFLHVILKKQAVISLNSIKRFLLTTDKFCVQINVNFCIRAKYRLIHTSKSWLYSFRLYCVGFDSIKKLIFSRMCFV